MNCPWLLDQMVAWLRRFLDILDTIVGGQLAINDTVRRIWIVLRLGIAIAIGLVVDRIPLRGFNVIDDQDLRAWLTRHGAPTDAVWSAHARNRSSASASVRPETGATRIMLPDAWCNERAISWLERRARARASYSVQLLVTNVGRPARRRPSITRRMEGRN